MAAALRRAPARVRSRSTSSFEGALNAAQCSRSTARRRRSPSRPRAEPQRAVADGLVPRLEVVDAVRHEDRQGARDDQMVERAVRVLDDPVPLVGIDHVAPPFDENAGRARVDHQQPRTAEVAVVGPAARRRLAVAHECEVAQPRTRVVVCLHDRKHLLLGELRRREVAEVLVQPVGHEGAGDALLPPRQSAHLVDPGQRDVPVVVHVVVVEDHRESARWRAASGCPDPTRTRDRAACTPRSRRSPPRRRRRCRGASG